MQTDPEPIVPTPPPGDAVPVAPLERNLLAPVWHTILMIVIMLGNSYLTAKFMAAQRAAHTESTAPRTVDYLLTIGLEFFLLFLVWIGLRIKKRTLRELIGGKWSSPEDVLIDVGIAVGFWVVAAAILVGLAFVLRQTDTAQINDMKQRLAGLIPQSGLQLAVFALLSVIAGLVEEIVFRGYLQQQIGILAGNIYVGLIASALIFGAGHGYEGTKNMVRIFVFGALFGLLALWRKSLRPGMIAHAFQDGLVGFATFFLSRSGMF